MIKTKLKKKMSEKIVTYLYLPNNNNNNNITNITQFILVIRYIYIINNIVNNFQNSNKLNK